MLDPQSARDRVGTLLDDKYRLDKLIGLGGMGAVYRGVHRWTERPVAVKILDDEVSKDPESIERFVREARALSRVGHRGIVQVLDLGRATNGSLYLVQALLDGETLRDHLARLGKLTVNECARIALPVLDALDAAHAAGIVHRDVKPENILLHRDPRRGVEPKLIDFGVARLDVQGLRLTRAGSLLGTPHYMAPEQIRGDIDIDPRADLWAMGVVLFECSSGERPVSAESLRELFAKVVLEPIPSLRERAPALPEAFVTLVDRALAKERARRWPSARAMLIELACVGEVRKDPSVANTLAALGLDASPAKTAIAGSGFAAAALVATAPHLALSTTRPDDSSSVSMAAASVAAVDAATLAVEPRLERPKIAGGAPSVRRERRVELSRVALATSLASATIVIATLTLRPPRFASAPRREPALDAAVLEAVRQPRAENVDAGVATLVSVVVDSSANQRADAADTGAGVRGDAGRGGRPRTQPAGPANRLIID